MGGRDRRESRLRSRRAVPAIPSVVATLEERSTAVSESASWGRIGGQRRLSLRRESPVMCTSLFVQENGPGGAASCGRGDLKRGAIASQGGPPLREGTADLVH
jgi:hypothetical protein